MELIAEQIHNNPILLAKSQQPKVKQNRKAAIAELLQKYASVFGKALSEVAFLKKMNIKTRLKAKTSKKILVTNSFLNY